MIDVSDGLIADARHLAEASGVCVLLDSTAWIISELLAEAGSVIGADPGEWMLLGGEDHGLLATFPAGATVPEPFVIIGAVEKVDARQTARTLPGVLIDGIRREGSGGHVHFGGPITG